MDFVLLYFRVSKSLKESSNNSFSLSKTKMLFILPCKQHSQLNKMATAQHQPIYNINHHCYIRLNYVPTPTNIQPTWPHNHGHYITHRARWYYGILPYITVSLRWYHTSTWLLTSGYSSIALAPDYCLISGMIAAIIRGHSHPAVDLIELGGNRCVMYTLCQLLSSENHLATFTVPLFPFTLNVYK